MICMELSSSQRIDVGSGPLAPTPPSIVLGKAESSLKSFLVEEDLRLELVVEMKLSVSGVFAGNQFVSWPSSLPLPFVPRQLLL